MEEKKRRGYKTKEQQNEANKRYRATEKGKEKVRYSTYKSRTNTFIKTLATLKDLKDIKKLTEEKIKEMDK